MKKEWSVDHILEKKLSAEEICSLQANALALGNEDVAQVCEDALAVLRGKHYELHYLAGRPAEPKEVIEAFFQGLSKYRQLKGTKAYPARTMQMIKNHGVIETIRRTGTQGNTATLEFMASKGRLEDTSEWLVSHGFPSLFSEADRQHALKRLKDACLV